MGSLKQKVKSVILRSDCIYRCMKKYRADYKRLEIESLYKYCLHNGNIVSMIDERTYRNCKKAAETLEQYERGDATEEIERKVSKVYLSELQNVNVMAETDGFIVNNYFLTDRIEWDKEGMATYYPKNIKIMDSNTCIISMDLSKEKYISKGISLIKMWSNNIFHFTFEALTRLQFVEDVVDYKDWPLVIDDIVRKDPRSMQLIDKININNRRIIWVDSEDVLKVGRLVILPCVAWGGYDRRLRRAGNGWVIDQRAAEYMREIVLRDYQPRKKYKWVFVARGNNNRLVNESQIIEYFSENGFEIFNPDYGSFWDEVDCFATAECIVGCAGGAFTNVIYCNRNAVVYKICPFEYQSASGHYVAELVGVNMHARSAIVVKRKNEDINTAQFFFPIEECQKIMNEIRGNI